MSTAPSSCLGIKSNALRAVKLWPTAVLALLFATTLAIPHGLFAAENEESLPEIEARSYELRVARKSRSGNVFLLETSNGSLPEVGRILLLRREGQPAYAVRVLKAYPDKASFAAKNLKAYPDAAPLSTGESVNGIEKIADIIPSPPTAEDQKDMAELEKPLEPELEVSPAPSAESEEKKTPPEPAPELSPEPTVEPSPGPEQDLEPVTPPAPEPSPEVPEAVLEPTEPQGPLPPPEARAEEEAVTDQDDLDMLGIAVEELPIFDPNKHALTLGFGFISIGGAGSGLTYSSGDQEVESIYVSAGGLRYAYTWKDRVWLRTAKAQDSLALELGLYYYKALNVTTTEGDAYTVVPIVGTARYNVALSENFSIFGYLGLMHSFASASTDIPDEPTAKNNAIALSSTVPALGVGLMYRVGPNWFARVDAGLDIVGLSLVLRF